jgi:Mycothiol maleylpyruvate isomerase N-terminal domain
MSMCRSSLISVVDLLPAERAVLLARRSELGEAEWTAPTACPGWTVHGVALHLLADDIGRLSYGRDRYARYMEAVAESGIDLSQWDQLVAFINRHNQAWVEAARRISLMIRSGQS